MRLTSAEFDQVQRTNNVGLFGADIPDVKPADEFRIVVLGDSYVAAGQVPYADTFIALLEQRLRAGGHANVRVINAGVGGYTTLNEAGLLREHFRRFMPDVVVVVAFLGNDVGENVLATRAGYRAAPEHPKGLTFGNAASELIDQSADWFPRNHTGRVPPSSAKFDPERLPQPARNATPTTAAALVPLPVVVAPATTLWDDARGRSRLLGRLFGEPLRDVGAVTTAPGARPRSVDQRRINVSTFEWTILRDVPRQYWLDAAWPLFGHYLHDIQQTALSNRAPTLVVALPEIAQFVDERRARTMDEFRFSEDEVDWDRPQRELGAQADRADVRLLDLLPLFRARQDRAALYLPQDTHLSALGHVVVADAIARWLFERHWVP
jgi:lysophospholipase L1-like esterase